MKMIQLLKKKIHWKFNSENELCSDATKDSNFGETVQAHLNNEKHTHKNEFELPKVEKKHKCNKCDKVFSSKKHLKRHDNIHKDNPPYQCNACSKVCSNISDLIKHERIHTGEKPFACKICKKTFSTSSILKSHEIVHTGEKPYICNTCMKKFSRIDSLKKHTRIHSLDELNIKHENAVEPNIISSENVFKEEHA